MKTIPKGQYLRTFGSNPLRPNTTTDFTRRLPALPKKQILRDARIVQAIINAHDKERDMAKAKDIFFRNASLLSNPRYWEVMRTVWVAVGCTENAHEFIPLMRSSRPCKGWFMTPEDKAALEAMPEVLQVYRAADRRYAVDDTVVFNPGMKPLDSHANEPDPGISWTLNRDWCIEYAKKKDRIVKGRMVKRTQVFAYITRRFEDEIIILPDEGRPRGSDV